MSAGEYLIGSTSGVWFEPDAVVRAAAERWPDAELAAADGDLGEIMSAFVYLPGPGRRTEVAVHRSGEGLGVDGADDDQVAEFVAWLAGTVPVPDDGSVVLINWAEDLVPLDPTTTPAELLASRSDD